MKFETIDVHCYSGYKLNERPVRFIHKDKTVQIAEIIDQWYEGHAASSLPLIDYYKVKADDCTVHIIRYNRLFDAWAILLLDTQE